jgi:hypothetical protein
MNASHDDVPFRLPPLADESAWQVLVDTSADDSEAEGERMGGATEVVVKARSCCIFVMAS